MFSKSIVITKTLDENRKYNPSASEESFEVLICERCHLTQWYNLNVLTNKEIIRRKYQRPYELPNLVTLKCVNCGCDDFSMQIIKPEDYFAGGRFSTDCVGEIFLRVCLKCALTEIYEIFLSHNIGSGNVRGKERQCIAKTFSCPICKSNLVSQTGQISFWTGLPDQPSYRPQGIDQSHLFITCKRCKYMEVFAGHDIAQGA